jgi:hypothetical protein
MINTLAKPSTTTHDEDCLCPACMDADMNAHILANGGQDALDRINNEMQLIGGGKVEAERMRFMPSGSRCGGGTVKPATTKMVKFLKVLLSTKELAGIHIFPGQYATVETAHKNSFQGGKALIDKLINANDRPNAVRMASQGQKGFIASLNSQIKDPGYQISEADINSVTFAEVNDVLNLLKSIIKAEREDNANKNNTPTKTEVTEGAYWYGELIARVQRSRQSNNLYVKLETGKGTGKFEYAPGVIRQIKAENMLTAEEMKAYAEVHHHCGDCGRKLTNKDSIAYGIGPICREKGYR